MRRFLSASSGSQFRRNFVRVARANVLALVLPVAATPLLSRLFTPNDFAALAIFTFLSNWTAFIWPLFVTTSKELYTLPVGLTSFAVESQVQWELIMTGAALATLPTLTVFLLLQRYIVRGVVLAGLKG